MFTSSCPGLQRCSEEEAGAACLLLLAEAAAGPEGLSQPFPLSSLSLVSSALSSHLQTVPRPAHRRAGRPQPRSAGGASPHASLLHLNCASSRQSHDTGRDRIKARRGLDGAGLMGNQPIKKLWMKPEGLPGPERHPGNRGRESRRACCPGAC